MSAVRIIGALPRDGRGKMSGSQVHHLPCRIKHDGPAKVDTYFLPTELDDGKLEAAFRGRRLEGTVVDLAAAGAVGVVFRETSAPTEAPMLPSETGISVPDATGTAEPAVSAAAAPQARAAVQKKPARGRGGYGGGGGGYGFGGGGAVSDENEDGDGDDDEEEQYALDFGGDDDEEEAAARPASSSSTLLGGAMRSAGASSAASGAASGAEEFGRCWMRTWEVDRAFDSATYW